MARGIPAFVHNFRGSEDLYPLHQVFETALDAVQIMDVNNRDFGYPVVQGQIARDYVIKKGWTLNKQVENIKAMLEG
jgi:hypothetical protein